ncbi:phosphoribulokinase/uridine kinase family protein [Thioclava sp. ES.031]|uniref:uridine kinase n=1 Tax=unclassified Thioclava TaxID=2621713 RepID=UPI000C011897|nr:MULTISPECIES: uridine kinase [unclassified Thioclava]MPQ96181.1 uridine kinase [Thioclava sp. JE_KL1]PFG62153.1 phosphoribulokinase/uridine kinase family protein [Thioclava sp. ES.031]
MGATKAQLEAILDLVDRQPRDHGRVLIAIAGPPGSGKSTMAEAVTVALNARGRATDAAALVPMDGFHLDNEELDRRNLRTVKGAPATFDVVGFRALVRRLRDDRTEIRYPLFSRAQDRTLPEAGVLPPDRRIVIVEGNYLLFGAGDWAGLARLFDATVMLALPMEVLKARLVSRWIEHGLSPEDALARACRNDLENARRVLEQSVEADLTLTGHCTGEPS